MRVMIRILTAMHFTVRWIGRFLHLCKLNPLTDRWSVTHCEDIRIEHMKIYEEIISSFDII